MVGNSAPGSGPDAAVGWRAFSHCARRQRRSSRVAAPSNPRSPPPRGYTCREASLELSGTSPYRVGPRVRIPLPPAGSRVRTRFPESWSTWPSVSGSIEKMQSAKDALPTLLPIGLGQRGGEFDKVFMDTFQLVVLRGQKPRAVLDREAETLKRLMSETGAPCWQPDPPSTGACQVQ